MMPPVPDERLAESWTLTEETSDTRFELPTMRVVGHTRLYEDTDLRAAVRENTGIDRRWRFFFATRLEFTPPLAPGIGPAMLYGTVSAEARREFATDLGRRGFEDVSRKRGERVRTETGDRASLTKYSAQYRLDFARDEPSTPTERSGARRTLPIVGWLGVWIHSGEFRLAGGAYPGRPLADVLDIEDDRLEAGSATYRDELLDLIRAVR